MRCFSALKNPLGSTSPFIFHPFFSLANPLRHSFTLLAPLTCTHTYTNALWLDSNNSHCALLRAYRWVMWAEKKEIRSLVSSIATCLFLSHVILLRRVVYVYAVMLQSYICTHINVDNRFYILHELLYCITVIIIYFFVGEYFLPSHIKRMRQVA